MIIGAALFFALAISPLIKRLASIFPSKSRNFAIALAYIIVVGFLIAFVAIVFPTIINETIRFLGNLPYIIGNATDNVSFINKIGTSIGIENLQNQIMQAVNNFSATYMQDLGGILTNSITSISNGIAVLILSLVLAFFMLTEGPSIVKQFWNNFSSDNNNVKRTKAVIHKLAETVSQYVSSAVTVSLINACATAVAVFIICLIFGIAPGFAFPFGLITGVFSLIPMFGSFIGGALVSLLLGFNAVGAGIAFLIYTIIYLQIESNVISPKIQGKGMKLPALVILSAVTIGVYTFGLVGAIISIPIAGCIKILIEEYAVDLMDDGKLNGSNTKNVEPKAEPTKDKKLITKTE